MTVKGQTGFFFSLQKVSDLRDKFLGSQLRVIKRGNKVQYLW